MGNVHLAAAFQSLRRMASGVECEHLCTRTQKSKSASVSDADIKIQIQGERLGAGEELARTPTPIPEFDLVLSAGDKFM
jgi:hypothetical protein